ncbi:hypothetical protein HGRIS_009436 [Hohenbuehelia grisea]|uniref:Uncharacterized protein n=1 Tax=Hohenbuehelia grisea TaxID=104357 RepID=A0ABR3J1J8_9AGAR
MYKPEQTNDSDARFICRDCSERGKRNTSTSMKAATAPSRNNVGQKPSTSDVQEGLLGRTDQPHPPMSSSSVVILAGKAVSYVSSIISPKQCPERTHDRRSSPHRNNCPGVAFSRPLVEDQDPTPSDKAATLQFGSATMPVDTGTHSTPARITAGRDRAQAEGLELQVNRQIEEINLLQATIDKLEQKNNKLRRRVSDLEGQKKPDIAVSDSFFDRIDQVSESSVIYNGNPSLQSINGAIDALVADLMEIAAENCPGPPPKNSFFYGSEFNPALLDVLRGREGEARDFVCEALLHDYLASCTWGTFFRDRVLHCPRLYHGNHSELENVYHQIIRNEPWSISQRWKAIAVSNASQRCLKERCVKQSAENIADMVVAFLAWSYSMPHGTFDRTELVKDLTTIFWDAHQLSIIIKRDVLSVRLTVVLAPRDHVSHSHLPLHPGLSTSAWPTMGEKQGDKVIGTYKLGLDAQTEHGGVRHLLKPEVVTEALLRSLDM